MEKMDEIQRNILWVALLPAVEAPVLASMTAVLQLLKESNELFELGREKRVQALQAAMALEKSIYENKTWTNEDIEKARKLASST